MIPVSLNQVPASGSATESDEETIDVIFPLLHGPNGEDGTVQGLLEMLNLPYVGNGVLASAVGMDKVVMKNLFAQAGLRQAKYVSVTKYEWKKGGEAVYDRIEQELGYPCFVKPANAGSSVGISKCKQRDDLKTAFAEAFKYDRKIIIEESIVGREIEIGLSAMTSRFVRLLEKLYRKKNFTTMKRNMKTGKRN